MELSLACLHHVLWTTEVSGTQHCLCPATTWLLICSNNCLPSSFSSLPCSVRNPINHQLVPHFLSMWHIEQSVLTVAMVSWRVGFLPCRMHDPLIVAGYANVSLVFIVLPRRCYYPIAISKVSWIQVPMESTSYLTHFLFRRFVGSYCIDGDKSQQFRSDKGFPVFKMVDATLLVACPWPRGIYFDSSWWKCFANDQVVYHLVEIRQ